MVRAITECIATIPGDGKAVVLIEHNMEILRTLCARLVYMEGGHKVLEGSAGAVLRDQRVLAGYVG